MAVSILVAGTGVVAGASSCSLALDHSATQCNTTDDCIAKGPDFAGLVCSDQHVCVKQGGCSTNQECVSANAGAPFYCRKDNRTCIPLQTDLCQPLAEPDVILDDNTVWFGVSISASIAPLHVYGVAADFARKEWNSVVVGLPPVGPGGKRRRLAIELCDDFPPTTKSDTVGDYLVNQLGVPVVIGPSTTVQGLKMAQTVTIPQGVMMMGVSLTSPLISTLDDHDLVWRTRPSDSLGGVVLAKYVTNALEQKVRTALSIPATDPIRVAEIYCNCTSVLGVASAFDANALFNGKNETDNGPNFITAQYQDPTDPNNTTPQASFLAAVNKVVQFKPHVIVGAGLVEFPSNILAKLESTWTEPTFKPLYILNDTPATQPDFLTLVSNNPDLQKRIRTYAYYIKNPLSDAFVKSFSDANPNVPAISPLAGFGYDAFYSVAYAAAALGSTPITGANLAASLRKLSSATTTIDTGPTNLSAGFQSIAAGQPFHLNGTTGPLNFDKNGDVTIPFEIACLAVDGTGKATGLKGSTFVYDPAKGQFTGTETGCP